MTDTSKLIERLKSEHGHPENGIKLDLLLIDTIAALSDLEARLRIAEKRADDAEARNDFLIKEMDKLIEKARQS